MSSERTPLIGDSEEYDESIAQPVPNYPKKPTPLPKLQIFCLTFIQFCEPITATVIFPFVVQLVRETGITKGDEAKTGYYAGFIESVFFAAEAVTVLGWGRLSDRTGRKPPLVLGTLGCAAAVSCFGLSSRFWMLILCRSVQGVFNGNIGITKAVVAEITDATNIAQAFSLMPLMWGVGVSIGPVIGGIFSRPAVTWPESFGKIQFLRDHPYFLPCIIAALIPLCACIFNLIFFEETLPSAISSKKSKDAEQFPGSNQHQTGGPESPVDSDPPPSLRSLMTPNVLIPFVNYALLAFVDQCCSVLMPLVFATSIPYGGLGLSPFAIGFIMSSLGVILGLSSALFFPPLSRRFGYRKIFRTAISCYSIVILTFPLMNYSARRAGMVNAATCVFLAILMACSAVTTMAYSSIFVFFSDSAPTKSSLGAINGMAQTIACTMRVFAPLAASSLFSATQQYNLFGGTLVYCVILAINLVGIYTSSKLPRQLRMEKK